MVITPPPAPVSQAPRFFSSQSKISTEQTAIIRKIWQWKCDKSTEHKPIRLTREEVRSVRKLPYVNGAYVARAGGKIYGVRYTVSNPLLSKRQSLESEVLHRQRQAEEFKTQQEEIERRRNAR